MADNRGTIIRSSNGDLYFIRDEVLKACKITEPEMKEFCGHLVDEATEVSAFNFGADSAVSLVGPFTTSSPSVSAEGTVMCPGVMHDDAFSVAT